MTDKARPYDLYMDGLLIVQLTYMFIGSIKVLHIHRGDRIVGNFPLGSLGNINRYSNTTPRSF